MYYIMQREETPTVNATQLKASIPAEHGVNASYKINHCNIVSLYLIKAKYIDSSFSVYQISFNALTKKRKLACLCEKQHEINHGFKKTRQSLLCFILWFPTLKCDTLKTQLLHHTTMLDVWYERVWKLWWIIYKAVFVCLVSLSKGARLIGGWIEVSETKKPTVSHGVSGWLIVLLLVTIWNRLTIYGTLKYCWSYVYLYLFIIYLWSLTLLSMYTCNSTLV